MSTVALATLGCKVNQCESAYLEEKLQAAGFQVVPFAERADIYCVNTCAVTGRAAMESRQLLRRAVRQNPGGRVVAMGCYAQVAAESMAAIPGVTHILGTSEKLELLDYLAGDQLPLVRVQNARQAVSASPLNLSSFGHRTRAFLKIQDGCNAFCSYCIVPYARGRSRSIGKKAVLAQVKRFLAAGHREIVLTGVHLGHWGQDLQPPENLVGLLREILQNCPPPRLRLSSLEPGEITQELLELMASAPELCPHLHIPLQSGDAAVLRRMNRHYSPGLYRERVREAVSRIPHLTVGADVLVGFPGETEENFQNTYRLLESLPVAYLHVFSFSPRAGTPAALMEDRVPSAVIRRRSAILRRLDESKRLRFMRRFLGQVRQVLPEGRRDRDTGARCGFSDNYIPVLIRAEADLENRLVRARLDAVEGRRMVATPV